MTAKRSTHHDLCSWKAGQIVFAIVVGLLYAYLVVGPRVLNPFDLSWLSGDPAMNQVGWEYFRRSRETWSITHIGAIGYPFGASVAYFDLVPSVAMFLKLFDRWLPESFQYLGPLFMANMILQAYFAVRLFRNVCGDNALAVLVGAAFLVIAPPLTFRAQAHFALTSQWLIVAALSYYLDDSSAKGPARYLLPLIALCAIAAGINPYLTLLTLFIAGAALLRLLLRGEISRTAAAGAAGVIVTAIAGSFALFGFFSLGGGYAGGGYGIYSMNPVAPLDPMWYPALLLPEIPIRPGQYEGYNYLGLGVIGMLVAGLALRPNALRNLSSPDHLPLALLCLVCTVLAVSATITFGPWLVWRIGPGKFIGNLLAYFRSSGRLFWPVHYLLIVGGFVLVYQIIPARFRGPVFGILLAIQFADTHTLRQSIKKQYETAQSYKPLTYPVWQTLGQRHRHLVVVLPWQCKPENSDEATARYWVFPMLAVRQGMTVNSYYSGRTDPEQLKYFCSVTDRIETEGMRADTAYAFVGNTFDEVSKRGAASRHVCQRIDGFGLCALPLGDQ